MDPKFYPITRLTETFHPLTLVKDTEVSVGVSEVGPWVVLKQSIHLAEEEDRDVQVMTISVSEISAIIDGLQKSLRWIEKEHPVLIFRLLARQVAEIAADSEKTWKQKYNQIFSPEIARKILSVPVGAFSWVGSTDREADVKSFAAAVAAKDAELSEEYASYMQHSGRLV